jgi:TRAP transporter TAXI family solute receptor
MSKRTMIILVLSAFLIFALLGCGAPSEPAKSGEPSESSEPAKSGETEKQVYRFSMATGGSSGTFYFVGAGVADLVHKYIPNVTIDVEATSASPENARLVGRKMADFALTTTEHSLTAYEGTGEYGEEEKGNIMAIRNSHTALFQIVTTNPNIKTVADLKGKRVAFGAPGSTTYLCQGPAIMGAVDMTYDDVKAEALHYNEAIEAMKDGNLDVAIVGAGAPTAAVIDLYSTHPGAHIVPMTEAEIEKMQELDPYCFGYYLPANSYKGQTEPILQPAIAQILVVNKDVPEDVVYEITKVLDEHTEELLPVHNAFSEWSRENVVLGIKVPYHPGADKYWKEVGLLK